MATETPAGRSPDDSSSSELGVDRRGDAAGVVAGDLGAHRHRRSRVDARDRGAHLALLDVGHVAERHALRHGQRGECLGRVDRRRVEAQEHGDRLIRILGLDRRHRGRCQDRADDATDLAGADAHRRGAIGIDPHFDGRGRGDEVARHVRKPIDVADRRDHRLGACLDRVEIGRRPRRPRGCRPRPVRCSAARPRPTHRSRSRPATPRGAATRPPGQPPGRGARRAWPSSRLARPAPRSGSGSRCRPPAGHSSGRARLRRRQ